MPKWKRQYVDLAILHNVVRSDDEFEQMSAAMQTAILHQMMAIKWKNENDTPRS